MIRIQRMNVFVGSQWRFKKSHWTVLPCPLPPPPSPPAGQDRSDKEQLAPIVRKGFLSGLLLWGGTEAAVRGVRHPWHSQHRDPWRWLPGRHGVHTRSGRQLLQLTRPVLFSTKYKKLFVCRSRKLSGPELVTENCCCCWWLRSPFTPLHCRGLKAKRCAYLALFADRGPEENDKTFVAEIREICRQIYHHSKIFYFFFYSVVVTFLLS